MATVRKKISAAGHERKKLTVVIRPEDATLLSRHSFIASSITYHSFLIRPETPSLHVRRPVSAVSPFTISAALPSSETLQHTCLWAMLPSTLEGLHKIFDQLHQQRQRVDFFLKYDGTLSPIVDDPDSATILEKTSETLSLLASKFTTAIVSGRSRKKVMSMVNLNQLIYAGSHGFDIEGPDGLISHRVASDWLPSLKKAYGELTKLVPRFPGASVEDNVLSISFHYRCCDPSIVGGAQSCVDEIAKRLGLVRTKGKMVYEIRPLLDWHKGKAVEYLLNALELMGPDVLPIYIGDDLTDEDAFKVLKGKGVSIIVAEPSNARNTHADMKLNNPFEVQDFLLKFAKNDYLVGDTSRTVASN